MQAIASIEDLKVVQKDLLEVRDMEELSQILSLCKKLLYLY